MIHLDRINQQLILRYATGDGYSGLLVVPTDPFSQHAYETVTCPQGNEIHNAPVPMESLGLANLEPYLVGMTRSARRDFRKVRVA